MFVELPNTSEPVDTPGVPAFKLVEAYTIVGRLPAARPMVSEPESTIKCPLLLIAQRPVPFVRNNN
jgi:hypothetical protein